MDLSKRDKDRLRKLAELYERDDLSDDEYRNQYNQILQNSRGTSELDRVASQSETQAGLPLIDESEMKPPEEELQPKVLEQASLEEMPAKEKSILEETLELARRGTEEALDNSIAQSPAADFEPESEGRKPTVALQEMARDNGGFGGGRERDRQDSIIRPPLSAQNPAANAKTARYKQVGRSTGHMRRRGGGVMSKLLVVSAVFGLGIVVALGVGYARTSVLNQSGGKRIDDKGTTPEKTPKTPVDVVEQPAERLIKPLFGVLAVNQCAEGCSRWTDAAAQKACARGCRRLSLSAYGRRITLQPLDARQDAERIAVNCIKRPVNVPRYGSEAIWRAKFGQTLNLLFEKDQIDVPTDKLAATSIFYDSILKVHEQLRLPPLSQVENDPITENLIRTTCLRAQLALTQVALGTVKERSDEFSWEFYSRLHQGLKPFVIEAESRLEQDAVKLGLR